MDEKNGELYVANDMGDSILVFAASAEGNVAPKRCCSKARRRGSRIPTGLFVDMENDELWVANFGAHAAVVFDRMAEGNTPPLRMIRKRTIWMPRV